MSLPGNPFNVETLEQGGGESDLLGGTNPFAQSPTEAILPQGPQEAPDRKEKSFTISPKAEREKPPEPENVRQWRENRKKMLEELDAAEKAKKDDMLDKAKSQYDTWYENYNSVVEKTKKMNRDSNQEFMEVNSVAKKKIGYMSSGANIVTSSLKEELTTWEYVAKLCDLAPNNRSIKSDVNRMRQLMLQLKADKFEGPSKKSEE